MELIETPNNMMLDEFKHQVKMWMELDNQLKKLAQIMKEKRDVQKALTQKILAFMTRFNIEDLNTKEGKLRYKVVRSKPALREKTIKQKLEEYFHQHDPSLGERVMSTVFQEKPVVEKVALRRLKSVNIINV